VTGPADLAVTLGHLQPACGRTVVVAIDGPSGSGKTKLAREITTLIGAQILHLDDIYRG
jgi:uridine kinase